MTVDSSATGLTPQEPKEDHSADLHLHGSKDSDHALEMMEEVSGEGALWKLNWFLQDFGYDSELLGRDEVDESQLVGLRGVVKISQIVINGTSLLRLDGLAPAGRWEELSPANLDGSQVA